MDGQTNGTGLVHDGPLYGLADPPGGIGRETETALGVELLDGADKAEVALFDEIQQHQAAVVVAPGNLDHQAQVGFNHALARRFVATQGTAGVVDFLFGREQGGEAYLPQIELGGVHYLVQLWRHQFIGNGFFGFGHHFLNLFFLLNLQLLVEL